MTVSLDGACPFQETDKRCGRSVVAFDKERTIAVCSEGHQSSSAHLIGAAGPQAVPVKFRHRRIQPKTAALLTVLAALIADSIVSHL